MGTSIKMEFIRGDNTRNYQWDYIKSHFDSEGIGYSDNGDFITTDIIYCPYSCANLDSQTVDLVETLSGSGITAYLWYEEREPDDTEEF